MCSQNKKSILGVPNCEPHTVAKIDPPEYLWILMHAKHSKSEGLESSLNLT